MTDNTSTMDELNKLKKLLEATVSVTDKSFAIMNHFKKLGDMDIVKLSPHEKQTIDNWIESYYALSAYITRLDIADSSVH